MSQNFMSSALRESLGVSHACSDAGPTTHHSMYHVLLSCPSFLKERLWLAKLYEVAPDLPFLNTVVPSGGISISVSTNTCEGLTALLVTLMPLSSATHLHLHICSRHCSLYTGPSGCLKSCRHQNYMFLAELERSLPTNHHFCVTW